MAALFLSTGLPRRVFPLVWASLVRFRPYTSSAWLDPTRQPSAAFTHSLNKGFPGAYTLHAFMNKCVEEGKRCGFTPQNTLPCVAVCRDELTQPFVHEVEQQWGRAFNMSALAGLSLCGRTGFKAAVAHAPIQNGTERCAFFSFAHIAMGDDGLYGYCEREERQGRPSHACGALSALQHEMESGVVRDDVDPYDVERSFLKQHILRFLPSNSVPSLLDLTHAAVQAIQHDLERAVELVLEKPQGEKANHLVFTGVHIHGPYRHEFVWPQAAYMAQASSRVPLSI